MPSTTRENAHSETDGLGAKDIGGEEPCVEVTWRKGDLCFEVLRRTRLNLTDSKKLPNMCTPTAPTEVRSRRWRGIRRYVIMAFKLRFRGDKMP